MEITIEEQVIALTAELHELRTRVAELESRPQRGARDYGPKAEVAMTHEMAWRIRYGDLVGAKVKDIADENGFSRRVAWIAKDDHVRRKVVYYDLDGELHRELSASQVKLVDEAKKRYRPQLMVMKNLQNKRRSELKIEKIQLREDIPDDYFTTRYLERQ